MDTFRWNFMRQRLLKNACMDFYEMLHVDRCRDMDELINCPIQIIVRIQEADLHRIFKFQRDIWRSYGQISMKFYMSIAAGSWANWLRFELDPDHSLDPWTGFTPDFWILAGHLKKLWTDCNEILCVDSCGGLQDLVRFWARSGHRLKIARQIALKVMDRFQWNFTTQ